jgi:hypothetical protein
MGRAIAALVIGAILLIGVLWIVSRLSNRIHGHGGTVIKIVVLIAVAVLAYLLVGEGLVFRYFSE